MGELENESYCSPTKNALYQLMRENMNINR